MNIKRVVSGLLLFPIVAVVMIFGNKYVVDVSMAIIAIMSIHEFYKAFYTGNKAKPITWLGYIAAATISVIHVLPKQAVLMTIGVLIPTIILILFLHTIFSKLKINIIDMSVTLFGVFYIAIFLMFISIIRELPNGKFLIWYVFFTAWGTDIFAYIVGKNFGKHHFTDVSPNKTIEGCIGGVIGAIVLSVIYTVACKYIFSIEYNYIAIILISLLLSILSQIGDLSASAVKRYTGIKDFSNLIPGHGGMLDRIDSIVFIAPFAYFLFTLMQTLNIF